MQALVTYKSARDPDEGDEVLFDWSDVKERRFCLDVENVTQVLVVVSNSNVFANQRLKGSMVMNLLEEPCTSNADMRYSATAGFNVHQDDGYAVTDIKGDGSEYISSDWEIAYDGRFNDEIHYVFTATNLIDVNGSGRRVDSDGGGVDTFTFSLGGQGVSHNPAQPGDAQAAGYTRENWPGDMHGPAPDSHGTIILSERNGKHVYNVSLGIAQIRPSYYYVKTSTGGCSYYRESYDNDSVQGFESQNECGEYSERTIDYGSPYTFGALVPNRQRGVPGTGLGGWMAGEYDPAIGILEGSEVQTIIGCGAVRRYEPLGISHLLGVGGDEVDPYTQVDDGCILHYNWTWRIELPKSGR